MPKRGLATTLVAMVLTGLLAIPAWAAYKHQFGYLWIYRGQASGHVTFHTEDETYASITVQDNCPGDAHYVAAWVQIMKNGDDSTMAYVSTRGHECGYGTSSTQYLESQWFDHQAARLVICRYPTGSYTAASCVYGGWVDNPYDN